MERLTTKELAPYLPYGLKVIGFNNYINKDMVCDLTDRNLWTHIESQSKPLLRPLSSLTEEEEWKRKLLSFLSDGRSDNYDSSIEIRTKPNQITFKIRMYYYRGLNNSELFEYTVYKDLDKRFTKYSLIEWAIENHFDVFGLIDRGLALPIDGKEVEGEN